MKKMLKTMIWVLFNKGEGVYMPHTFRIRRGLEKDIPRLAPGEPALTTDTRKFYIGTADGNLLINPVISPLENEIEHMNPIVASLIFGRKE